MDETIRLLVVDDDDDIRELLAAYLVKNGYQCETARDGSEMFARLSASVFDLIILDLMLPGEDGLQLCNRLRRDSVLPVIMLTARGEEADRIVGLEMGADDYIAKPFNPRELEARIKAVLRRTRGMQPVHESTEGDCLFDGWRLNTRERKLISDEGQDFPLGAAEYDMLQVFLRHAGRVLSRDQLMDLTKGREAMPFDRSVDMQISRLRKRLGSAPGGGE